MQRIMMALMAVAVAFAVATSAQAQSYTYTGPALATDSGLSCVGGTAADENMIDRTAQWGVANHLTANGTYLDVFCPLRRRNSEAYGRQAQKDDSVLINKVTVFVRSTSLSGVLSCQVYAYSSGYEDRVFETAPKYACNTNGGCTSKPANAYYGFKQLVFDFPFGNSRMDSMGVVNIGYRCSIPNNWSRVIGAQAEFKSNHE